jgi:hypothetical protein
MCASESVLVPLSAAMIAWLGLFVRDARRRQWFF